MQRFSCDLLILGSGFSGSLLANIARKIGLDVMLLERGRHPRFAIGESSTPLANYKLQQLARQYGLTWLDPLTKYGPWKRSYAGVACGLKRGFSFFAHAPGTEFRPSPTHENELLVTANPSEELGDTHWYRSEFDALLVNHAVSAGVQYVDQCSVTNLEHDQGWRARGTTAGVEMEIRAPFLVDAAGEGSPLADVLGLTRGQEQVRTCSRALFGHFTNVRSWADSMDELGANRCDHPFLCDAAALHHVFDGGWMWMLRFDNGITSAGFSLNPRRFPVDLSSTAADEWETLLRRYPSIRQQFQSASCVHGLMRTRRLQRRLSQAAGMDWAILPHGAAFTDPWLSPGIAHTLHGVERLARVFADSWRSEHRASGLVEYQGALFREFDMIDRITSACFARLDCFPVLVTLSMLYFVGVTFAEEEFRGGGDPVGKEFLLAHDESFVSLVHEITELGRDVPPNDAGRFAQYVAKRLEPYNGIGLCDSQRRNMYPYCSKRSCSVSDMPRSDGP